MNMNNNTIKRLEDEIGYTFTDKNMLKMALTHSSYANEHHIPRYENNERLEYLGDAVLELVVSTFLYQNNPDMPEGDMTKLRASIVCEPTLYLCAQKFSLGQYLFLGKGEELTGGRNRASVVSDAMEALIGAIYLDGQEEGFERAKMFIHRFILDDLDHLKLFLDSKTILQEIVQGMDSGTLSYETIGQEGPDHNKTFVVHAILDSKVLSVGRGHTKKAAEQEAAYYAILELKKQSG